MSTYRRIHHIAKGITFGAVLLLILLGQGRIVLLLATLIWFYGEEVLTWEVMHYLRKRKPHRRPKP